MRRSSSDPAASRHLDHCALDVGSCASVRRRAGASGRNRSSRYCGTSARRCALAVRSGRWPVPRAPALLGVGGAVVGRRRRLGARPAKCQRTPGEVRSAWPLPSPPAARIGRWRRCAHGGELAACTPPRVSHTRPCVARARARGTSPPEDSVATECPRHRSRLQRAESRYCGPGCMRGRRSLAWGVRPSTRMTSDIM